MENMRFAGNSMEVWLYFCAIVAGLAFILWLLKKAVLSLMRQKESGSFKYTEYVKSVLQALVKGTSIMFIIGVSLLVGLKWVEISPTVRRWVYPLSVILFIVQGGLWLNSALGLWVRRIEHKYDQTDAGKLTTFRALAFVGRIFIILLVAVLALDQIPGVEVSALITGLGIGGIAIALAVQNVLADLFASLSISLDKPFAIGDFIIIDNYLGTVQKIGLKTTRIQSLSGEQLVFANNDLLNSRIRNYKRMKERRVPFTIGVTYDTGRDKLAMIPEIFKEVLGRQKNVRFDRAHFKEYGPYSLNFEFVYYVLSPDYNQYMDIQQAINMGLNEEFEKRDIEFAYPTQTLYVSGPQIKTACSNQTVSGLNGQPGSPFHTE